MFKDAKLIVVILLLSVIVFVGASALLFSTVKKERNEKVALQNELAGVMKERKKLSEEVDELKLIKSDLEAKVNGMDAQNKVLAENYDKEKAQNDSVRMALSKKEEEVSSIKTRLDSALSEKNKMQKMLDDEKAKYQELRGRIDKLIEAKDVLEEKVRDIVNKQGIELEKIVVRAEGELEGKVLVVNRDYNFVVVDIGLKDDIKMDTVLTLFRDGKYVGEAKVEKIYDTMSAATISKEIKAGSIMVDDRVIVRGE